MTDWLTAADVAHTTENEAWQLYLAASWDELSWAFAWLVHTDSEHAFNALQRARERYQ